MKEFRREIYKIKKSIHLNVLAAANTYYLLLLMFPFALVNLNFNNIKLNNFFRIFGFGIVFIIEAIFVVSRYLNNLKLTTDILYKEIPTRNKMKEFIKSVIMIIFLVVLISFLVLISYLIFKYVDVHNYFIYKAIEYGISFIIMLACTIVIYKYTLPVYVSFRTSFNVSVILSVIWVVISGLYYILEIFIKLYFSVNNFLNITFFIFFLYLFNYIVILSFAYNYMKTKNTKYFKYNINE